MNPVFDLEWRSAVAVSSRCAGDALQAARRGALLLPLLPWLIARAAAALWLGGFPVPPRDRVAFLWEHVGGEAATHFPMTAATLPRLMEWLDPGLELVLGVFGIMWVCALLPEVYRGEAPSWRAARARLGWRVVTAWLASLPGIVGSGAFLVLADVFRNLPVGGAAAHAVALVLAVLCRAFFVYAVCATVIGGVSPLKAWKRSTLLAERFLAPTIAFVVIVFVTCVPWRVSPHLALGLFGRFAPEWAAPWVALGAVPLVVATLFATAATTRLYLHGYGGGSSR